MNPMFYSIPDSMELRTPARMDPCNLPTCQQVFSHYLYLRSAKIGTGEWKINVPQLTVVREVITDLLAQWAHPGYFEG